MDSGFTSESNNKPLLNIRGPSTVFACLTLLLISCSLRSWSTANVSSFPGESLLPLISSTLPPSSFLPLSFVYSGEGGAQDQTEKDWIMMSSCAFQFLPRKLNGEDNSTNWVKEPCWHLSPQLLFSGTIAGPLFCWLCPLHGTTLNQSEPHWRPAMDCTAAILKACARSRAKWCRHERSSVRRQWRPADSCRCGGDVTSAGVVSHGSSLLQRLLFYACCCLSRAENSELCQEWVDRPGGGRGRSEDEGESEGPSLSFCPDVLVSAGSPGFY